MLNQPNGQITCFVFSHLKSGILKNTTKFSGKCQFCFATNLAEIPVQFINFASIWQKLFKYWLQSCEQLYVLVVKMICKKFDVFFFFYWYLLWRKYFPLVQFTWLSFDVKWSEIVNRQQQMVKIFSSCAN